MVTCDVPGAFMCTNIDELVHLKLDGDWAKLLVKVDPTYQAFITHEHAYNQLTKALYGTLQAALLFWQNLSEFLIQELGFMVNPYDWCVVNKNIQGQQCTIRWHVDDLKISHISQPVVEEIVQALQSCYGQEAPLVVHHGPIQEYLDMTIDYSHPGQVSIQMDTYVNDLLSESPDILMKGASTTPETNHLFQEDPDCPKLGTLDAVQYHHLVAKYICTHVQAPDEDDWKKLGQCLQLLSATK